jgi:hypothetical protein
MFLKDLELYRNKDGYIDLDKSNYNGFEEEIKGKRKKKWVLFDDGKVLFKETFPYSYEHYSELVSCEVSKQMGIETAEYDLAILNGKKGVISYNFLKSNETLISGAMILNHIQEIYKENNKNVVLTNNICDISIAIQMYVSNSDYCDRILFDLCKTYFLDLIMLESDRHTRNWSIIFNGQYSRLAPRYDSGSIVRTNRQISSIVQHANECFANGKIRIKSIEYHLKNIKNNLVYSRNGFDINAEDDFSIFAREQPEVTRKLSLMLPKLNIDEVFQKIECKLNNPLPYEYKLWLKCCILYRVEQLNEILIKEGYANNELSRIKLEEPSFGEIDYRK